MLIGVRNNILTGGILFALLCLLLTGFTSWWILTTGFALDQVAVTQSHPWWFIYRDVQTPNFLFSIITSVILPGMIFIWGFILKNTYRKTSSPEIFFFSVFILSLSFEGLRLLNLPLADPYSAIYLAKFVYFGRFMGTAGILFSSLYAIDYKYRKFGTIMGMAMAVSITLAYILPMDRTLLTSDFLFHLGEEGSLFLIFQTCALVSLINFAIAGFRKHKNYLGLALGTFLTLGGREMLLFETSSFIIIPGMMFLLAGIILFNHKINKIYFWG